MRRFNQTIIFLGPAGSGKGTQAELLAAKFNLQRVTAGDVLREKAKTDPELEEKLQKGIHLTDREMKEYMSEALYALDKNKGVVLDGYPRSVGQAKDIEEILREQRQDQDIKAVWVKISDEEALIRLLKRSVCKVCGTLYIGRDIEKCEKCGGEVEVRHDDTEEAIRKRLLWYHQNVIPAIEYYRSCGLLIEINGEQSIEDVHREILTHLSSRAERRDA